MGPLCEAGADPSANMKNNFSPLDFAAEFNHLETVELLCSYGASNRAEAALQASRAGHSSLARWLEASEDWTTPLHHLSTLSPERAYRLLREGADLHAAVAPGRPSPLTIACEMHEYGEAPPQSAAALVLEAAESWSIRTHELFPTAARGRAVELMRLGALLSRCNPVFAGREHAILDAWVTFVLPGAIER